MSLPTPYYQDAQATIYCADARTILPDLPSDLAIVSDVPYGINWDTVTARFSGGKAGRSRGSARNRPVAGDADPFDPVHLLAYPRVLLWGGNHFADKLPPGAWAIWLKKPPVRYGTFLSDAELAWFNAGRGVYAIEIQWEGCMRTTECGQHFHPTQKPVALMRWSIDLLGRSELTVCDPYMGSGTTLRAAKDLGRKAIGIEIEERYCEIAAKRLAQEVLPFSEPEREGRQMEMT